MYNWAPWRQWLFQVIRIMFLVKTHNLFTKQMLKTAIQIIQNWPIPSFLSDDCVPYGYQLLRPTFDYFKILKVVLRQLSTRQKLI